MKSLALFVVVASLYTPTFAQAQDASEIVIVTQTPNGPVINPDDNPHLKSPDSSREQADILSALSQVENFGTEVEALIDLVGGATSLQSLDSEILDKIEAEILSWTKPLPASNPEANFSGYRALANIRPENTVYSGKRDDYKDRVVELKQTVLDRFKTTTDEFSGITWYKHRSQPRYSDTRPYVLLYLGKKDGRPPLLRFVLNYTNDSWLFVQTAQLNIDGDIVDVPANDWQRDNDSEVWEWIDVVATSPFMEIARRIAYSKKTIVRFNGQQYYDNYTVTSEDKQVLRDGLLAYEVMLEQER